MWHEFLSIQHLIIIFLPKVIKKFLTLNLIVSVQMLQTLTFKFSKIAEFFLLLVFFFFFNRHCNPCGFGLLNYPWGFSAGRFLQSAVARGTSNSQPGGPVIRTFQLPPPGVPHVWNDASEPQQRKVELWARKFPRILPKVATSASLLSSFTCSQFTTWDRRLYFPSGGRHAEDFLARKIRRLEPANVGTRGQHAYL